MNQKDKVVLKMYIRELLHLEKDIVVVSDDGMVHLIVKGVDFYIYIKSLTYAGNPYPLNTTRAQLPKRKEFESIKKTDAVFLFLGYDSVNEVFACWDPIVIKSRLNEKQYVSFFCRRNLQESVRMGIILASALSNGLKYVLFKQNDLAQFLLNIKVYFPDLSLSVANYSISDKIQGILYKVEEDASVKLLIDEMCSTDPNISIFSLLKRCMNEFGEFYHRMTLKDWYHLINVYLSSVELQARILEQDEWDDNINNVAEPSVESNIDS